MYVKPVESGYSLAYPETQYESLRTRNKSVFVTKMIGMTLKEPIVKRRSLAILLAKEICYAHLYKKIGNGHNFVVSWKL